MNGVCLQLHHRFLSPLLSLLPPPAAYGVNGLTGTLGRSLSGRSLIFSSPHRYAAGMAAMQRHLGVDTAGAEAIMRGFFRLESRILLEHLWLGRQREDRLGEMISMPAVRRVSEAIHRQGPLLLLSAHTAYYFLIPWALHSLGHKVAFVMADLRHDHSDNLLNISGRAAVEAMSRRLPVLFVNEGNTVARCADLLKEGCSVVLLVDLPGYRGRGIPVRLFGREVWLPAGCRWIHETAGAGAAAVFSYAAPAAGPYEVSFTPLTAPPAALDLQGWAGALEAVLRISPESWIGWFLLKEMETQAAGSAG